AVGGVGGPAFPYSIVNRFASAISLRAAEKRSPGRPTAPLTLPPRAVSPRRIRTDRLVKRVVSRRAPITNLTGLPPRNPCRPEEGLMPLLLDVRARRLQPEVMDQPDLDRRRHVEALR